MSEKLENHHHLWFERRSYAHGFERHFRNYGGFVIKTAVTTHNDLHAEVPPPPKPSHDLMTGLMLQMDTAPPEVQKDIEKFGVRGLHLAIAYLDEYKRHQKYDEMVYCHVIQKNLERQRDILRPPAGLEFQRNLARQNDMFRRQAEELFGWHVNQTRSDELMEYVDSFVAEVEDE